MTAEALACLELNDEERIRWMWTNVGETSHDLGGSTEGDIANHLERHRRQSEVEKVRLDHCDARRWREPLSKFLTQPGVKFHGLNRSTTRGEFGGDYTMPRPDLDNEIVTRQPCLCDQPSREGATPDEVLGEIGAPLAPVMWGGHGG